MAFVVASEWIIMSLTLLAYCNIRYRKGDSKYATLLVKITDSWLCFVTVTLALFHGGAFNETIENQDTRMSLCMGIALVIMALVWLCCGLCVSILSVVTVRYLVVLWYICTCVFVVVGSARWILEDDSREGVYGPFVKGENTSAVAAVSLFVVRLVAFFYL